MIQKFLKTFLSNKLFADMEAESKSWVLKCPNCGYERSIWELGGIRYKASGNSKKYVKCINCAQNSWHELYRRKP